GICGTDVHLYDGGRPFSDDPQILGHEFAGEVVDVGAGVSRVATGDRVAIMPIVACGRCELCRRGDGHLCRGHETVGLRHPWGGFDVLNPLEVDVPTACRERSAGRGFDAAIDCAGNAAALQAAFGAVRSGGTVAVTAVHQRPVELDVRAMLTRSVSLVGALAYP